MEATLAKIKELPEYVTHAPAAFKEHIHAIQAIEDPYEQGKAAGEFMGQVLLAGGAVGKISSKLGRWIQPTKNAYEIAKLPGAKHYETYIRYRIKTSRELNKGMRSFQRRIDEHRDKISNPQNYDPKWHTNTKNHQQNQLINWKKEIKGFSEQMEIFKGCLQERK